MKHARRKASGEPCPLEEAGKAGLLLVLLLPQVGFDFEQISLQTLLGMLTTAAVVLIIAWRRHRKTIKRLRAELCRALEQARNSNRERDLAQGELLLRLDQERELNKQKMQLQAQLADYEKCAALAQMALGAAHEINNPLLGILSHLELELKASNPEAHTEIEQCIESAKRISATTRGLLNYTRPDPVRVSRIQLGRLLGELLSFLQHQPLLRTLQVENRVTSDVPAIYADSQQLSQVLMNVLLNAAEATPAGGSIRVEAQAMPATKEVEIRVTDTGNGIPPDILPHIFEPFFTTKRGKGTGLGLSISQAFIRRHGGEIRVESTPGKGTTVRITLPIGGRAALAAEEENTEVVV